MSKYCPRCKVVKDAALFSKCLRDGLQGYCKACISARYKAKMLGFKWHVDHIVPLKSKRVSGFHVEHNLQVIPAVQNWRKHNSYWPNMPEGV